MENKNVTPDQAVKTFLGHMNGLNGVLYSGGKKECNFLIMGKKELTDNNLRLYQVILEAAEYLIAIEEDGFSQIAEFIRDTPAEDEIDWEEFQGLT